MLEVLNSNLQLAKERILESTRRNTSRGNERGILDEDDSQPEQYMKYIDLKEFAEMETSLINEGFKREFEQIKNIIKEIAS